MWEHDELGTTLTAPHWRRPCCEARQRFCCGYADHLAARKRGWDV